MNISRYFKLSILMMVLIGLISCGGNSSGSNSSETEDTAEFKTLLSSEELNSEYKDVSVDKIIKVEFSEELSYAVTAKTKSTENGEEPPALNGLTQINNNNLFHIYLDNQSVDGTVFISEDKRSLIFISKEFFKFNKEYKAVLSGNIQSSKGKKLESNMVFYITTNNEQNLANIKMPTYVLEGDNVDIELQTVLKVWHIRWDLFTAVSIDGVVEDVESLTHSFDEAGVYTIEVMITDEYGRYYASEKDLAVLKNTEKYLMSLNTSSIGNVSKVIIEDLEESELKNAMIEYKSSILSIATSTHEFEDLPNDSLDYISFTIIPDVIQKFMESYIKKLINNNKYLGVVRLAGMPTIVSYEKINDDTYELNLLINDFGVNFNNFSYKDYVLNVATIPISHTPVFHNVSFKMDKEIFQNLYSVMPKDIEGLLPVLGYENDELFLTTFERRKPENKCCGIHIHVDVHVPSPSDVYNDTKHIIGQGVHDIGQGASQGVHDIGQGVNVIKNIVKHITDFISNDTFNLLKNISNALNMFFQQNPDKILKEFKNVGDGVTNNLKSLDKLINSHDDYIHYLPGSKHYSSSPSSFDIGIGAEIGTTIGTVTPTTPSNPYVSNTKDRDFFEVDRMIKDYNGLLYTKDDISFKSVINDFYIAYKANQDILDGFYNFFTSFETDIYKIAQDYLNSSDKDAFIYFVDKSRNSYLKVKFGNQEINVSYGTLQSILKAKLESKFGENFPFTKILDLLYDLSKYTNDDNMIGIFYKSGESYKFLLKFGYVDFEDCNDLNDTGMCLGSYITKNGVNTEVVCIAGTTNYEIGLKGKRGIDFDDETIDKLEDNDNVIYDVLDAISIGMEALPQFNVELYMKDHGNVISAESGLEANLSFLAGIEGGLEFDYAVYIGGEVSFGVEFDVVLDVMELLRSSKDIQTVVEDVGNIINEAFNNTSDNTTVKILGTLKEGDKEKTILGFSSDKEFIHFIKVFSSGIKDLMYSKGLSDITDSLKFKIEIGGDVGIEFGEGGSISGGVGAGADIGFSLEAEWDLTLILQLVGALEKYGVDVFILTPIRHYSELAKNNPDLHIKNFSDVEKAVKIFGPTYMQLVENHAWDEEGEEFIISLFETLAEHFEVGIAEEDSFQAHAEEVVSGSIKLGLYPKAMLNGEAFFFAVYAGIYLFDEFSNDNATEYKKYFVHDNADPELKFLLPVAASVKGAISEVVEAGVKLGVSTLFIDGAFSFKHFFDFTREEYFQPLYVKIKTDTKNISSSDNLSLTCKAKTVDGSKYDITWYLSGKKIPHKVDELGDTTTVNVDYGKVSLNDNSSTLTLIDFEPGEYSIECLAENKVTQGADFISITVNK